MNILITSPFTHISKNIHSHRAAQAAIYADQLSNVGHNVHLDISGDIAPDPNTFDEVYVYHGNDWAGSLNLFGGMKNYGGIDNLIRYSKIKSKVYSLWIDHPKYSEMLKSRMNGDIHDDWNKVDWNNLNLIENQSTIIREIEDTDKIVVGDSHAISMYRPGWFVNSVPFKTLHGALKEKLSSFIEPNHRIAEFYFGNIDVRHHLLRMKNPEKSTRNLVNAYYNQLLELDLDEVSVYELLPIENECRQIPKSGHYKNKPFHGSWNERNNIRLIFKNEMEKLCANSKIKFISWVDYLINDKGELSFYHMEKPRSVHLSRNSYPHWQGRKWSGLGETFATLDKFFK
jgi:hypothetical protein